MRTLKKWREPRHFLFCQDSGAQTSVYVLFVCTPALSARIPARLRRGPRGQLMQEHGIATGANQFAGAANP